jgi:hypothetical protein
MGANLCSPAWAHAIVHHAAPSQWGQRNHDVELSGWDMLGGGWRAASRAQGASSLRLHATHWLLRRALSRRARSSCRRLIVLKLEVSVGDRLSLGTGEVPGEGSEGGGAVSDAGDRELDGGVSVVSDTGLRVTVSAIYSASGKRFR